MTPELQPLFNLIKPGVPCVVECHYSSGIPPCKLTFDGSHLRDENGYLLPDMSIMPLLMAPRWRLAQPKPLIEWDKRTDDLWVSKCNRFVIFNDGFAARNWHPWQPGHFDLKSRYGFHSREDAVAWCEERAKAMQEAGWFYADAMLEARKNSIPPTGGETNQ